MQVVMRKAAPLDKEEMELALAGTGVLLVVEAAGTGGVPAFVAMLLAEAGRYTLRAHIIHGKKGTEQILRNVF